MEEQDYLVHYGVLGMKWGVRKDKNYKYTSMRTKHLTKKAAKAKEKGKKNAGKIAQKLKVSKQTDKNYLAYAKKTSVGKAIAQGLIFGPGGARTYQSMRANGVSQGKALTTQLISKLSGYTIGALVGSTVGKAVGAQVGALNGSLPNFFKSRKYAIELGKLMNQHYNDLSYMYPTFKDLTKALRVEDIAQYKGFGSKLEKAYNDRISDVLGQKQYNIVKSLGKAAEEYKTSKIASGAAAGASTGRARGAIAGAVGSGLVRTTNQAKKKKKTSTKRKHSIT